MLDSIAKNAREPYRSLFAPRAASIFGAVWDALPPERRGALGKLAATWERVFPAYTLEAVRARMVSTAAPAPAPVQFGAGIVGGGAPPMMPQQQQPQLHLYGAPPMQPQPMQQQQQIVHLPLPPQQQYGAAPPMPLPLPPHPQQQQQQHLMAGVPPSPQHMGWAPPGQPLPLHAQQQQHHQQQQHFRDPSPAGGSIGGSGAGGWPQEDPSLATTELSAAFLKVSGPPSHLPTRADIFLSSLLLFGASHPHSNCVLASFWGDKGREVGLWFKKGMCSAPSCKVGACSAWGGRRQRRRLGDDHRLGPHSSHFTPSYGGVGARVLCACAHGGAPQACVSQGAAAPLLRQHSHSH